MGEEPQVPGPGAPSESGLPATVTGPAPHTELPTHRCETDAGQGSGEPAEGGEGGHGRKGAKETSKKIKSSLEKSKSGHVSMGKKSFSKKNKKKPLEMF